MYTSHKTMYIPFVFNPLFREIKIKCLQSFQMSRPNSLNFSMHIIFPRLTLWPLRTSILVSPAAYVSCWGVEGAATHLSAITQSCLLCRVASRESCPTFIPFRHDKNIEWYRYCSFVFWNQDENDF